MLKQLLKWEYHANYKRYSKTWSKETIFKYSITSLSSGIALFYFFPALLIIASLVIYGLDYQFKVNKHLGAIPFAIMMLLFIVFLKRKLTSTIYYKEEIIASSTFNQKMVKNNLFFRLMGKAIARKK